MRGTTGSPLVVAAPLEEIAAIVPHQLAEFVDAAM